MDTAQLMRIIREDNVAEVRRGAGPVAGAGGNGDSGGGTPEPLGGPGGEPGNAPAAGGIRHQDEPECRG